MRLKIISFYLMALLTSFSFICFAVSPNGDGKEMAKEFLKTIADPQGRKDRGGTSFFPAEGQGKGEMTEVFKTTEK
jgi:hypothetical protein